MGLKELWEKFCGTAVPAVLWAVGKALYLDELLSDQQLDILDIGL